MDAQLQQHHLELQEAEQLVAAAEQLHAQHVATETAMTSQTQHQLPVQQTQGTLTMKYSVTFYRVLECK